MSAHIRAGRLAFTYLGRLWRLLDVRLLIRIRLPRMEILDSLKQLLRVVTMSMSEAFLNNPRSPCRKTSASDEAAGGWQDSPCRELQLKLSVQQG